MWPRGVGISYSVGNPMGALSSWASFAVAHHYLVFDSCRELGMDWKSAPYCLLGDDILIGDRALAKAYRRRMSEMGVGISEHKTLVSSTTLEFAKRYLHHGSEVSPFPLSVIAGNLRDVPLVVAGLMGEERKGLKSASGPVGATESLYEGLHRRGKEVSRVGRIARTVEKSVRFTQGAISAKDLLFWLVLNEDGPEEGLLRRDTSAMGKLLAMTDEDCQALVDQAIVSMFSSSLVSRGIHLGRLAKTIVEDVTN